MPRPLTPTNRASLAKALRRLADQLEGPNPPECAEWIVSGGEALHQDITAYPDENGVLVPFRTPMGFAPTNHTVLIGSEEFVRRALATHPLDGPGGTNA